MCQVQQRKLSRVSSIVLDLVKYNVNSIALHKKTFVFYYRFNVDIYFDI